MKSKNSLHPLAPTTSSNFKYLTSQVFFRDKLTPFAEASVSIASSPVLYGLAIYTVFCVTYDSNQKCLYIFRLKDHYKRLIKSAKIMGFDGFCKNWPYDKFEASMINLIKANKISDNVLVRVTVFIDELMAGTKITGLANSLSAYIYPATDILPRSGVNLCVSSWQRNSDNALPARAKLNGSYINSSLMKNEALLNGYDDAIAINSRGHVAESSVANIFLVSDGKLITPPVSADILEGITRDTVIKLASDIGIDVFERDIDRSELYIADEVFLCGSSARITPVLSIDKRILSERVGPRTRQISKQYEETIKGLLPAHADWVKRLVFV
jgi:branched-chain amino acid aminotransferase